MPEKIGEEIAKVMREYRETVDSAKEWYATAYFQQMLKNFLEAYGIDDEVSVFKNLNSDKAIVSYDYKEIIVKIPVEMEQYKHSLGILLEAFKMSLRILIDSSFWYEYNDTVEVSKIRINSDPSYVDKITIGAILLAREMSELEVKFNSGKIIRAITKISLSEIVKGTSEEKHEEKNND